MNYIMKDYYMRTTFAQGVCAWHGLLLKVKKFPQTMERRDVSESMERAIISLNDYVMDGFQKANSDMTENQFLSGKTEVEEHWLERMPQKRTSLIARKAEIANYWLDRLPPRKASLEIRDTLHELYHSKELLEESEKFYTQIYRLIVEMSECESKSEIEQWLRDHSEDKYIPKIYHSYYYDALWIDYAKYTGNDEYV